MRDVLGHCRDRRDRITDEAYGIKRQCMLVFGHWQDAESIGQLLPHQRAEHAMHRQRSGKVDILDARMRHGAAHQFYVGCAWKLQVICKTRLAGDLRAAINAAERRTDDLQVFRRCLVRGWN